jgi:hypothetical protein
MLGPASPSDSDPASQNASVIGNPDSDGPAGDYENKVFYLLLEIPKEVGNEIQSDSVGLDLVFEAEQIRNNSNPFSS